MKNSYDILCIFIVFSLLFTIGFHLGNEEVRLPSEEKIISIELYKIKGDAYPEEKVLIDGRIDAKILSYGNGILTLSCSAKTEKAGLLLGGAKYVSLNQPIKLKTASGYFEGRISKIIH